MIIINNNNSNNKFPRDINSNFKGISLLTTASKLHAGIIKNTLRQLKRF
jgi:hypothetical protein